MKQKAEWGPGAFWKYVSFNILSMIGLSCFVFVDTLCIANGVGSDGLAALNLVIPVYSLVNGVGLMLGMGGATLYSMEQGMGQGQKANIAFTRACRTALILGILFTVSGVAFTKPLGILLGAEGKVMECLIPYMRTLLAFSVPFLFNNVLVCFVRNDRNPRLAMAAMLTGSFSNILLDTLFIFGFGWGMFGAAFATGLAPLFSMLVASAHIWKGKNQFRLEKCRFQGKALVKLMSLGGASFVTEISSGIVILLFNYVILNLTGSVGVAAYGVIANLAIIVMSIFNGIAQGIQPLVSRGYGSGDIKAVFSYVRRALILAGILGVLCCLPGILFTHELIGIFNGGGDAAFEGIAAKGMPVYFTAFLTMGLNIVAAAVLASVDRARESLSIALLRGIVLNAVLVFLLPGFWGMQGIWLVVPIAESGTILLSFYYIFKYWKYSCLVSCKNM
ncbi:MATE family efflux transporter [Lactonifactor longoviformis]|nr:MATE family efflux transporter [Lactonifactor longoviformis]MCQ4673136.1 MATE family efflux transporter [Lactonifactor longoviformis]